MLFTVFVQSVPTKSPDVRQSVCVQQDLLLLQILGMAGLTYRKIVQGTVQNPSPIT